MITGDRYTKILAWSDEDQLYIGSCPELFHGGCHGTEPKAVFEELCEIIEEYIEHARETNSPIPEPLTSDDFSEAIQNAVKNRATAA